MPLDPRSPAHLALLSCAVAALAAPAAATAIDAPVVASSVPSPTNATSAAFTWSAVAATEGGVIVRYEGGLVRDPAADPPLTAFGPDDAQRASGPVGLPGEGAYVWKVRAVESVGGGEVAGPYGSRTVLADHVAPTIRASLSPGAPNGDNGWYRIVSPRNRLVVGWTCADPGGSGIAACPADEQVTANGANQTRTAVVRDNAGNVGTATSSIFSFDSVAPRGSSPRSPSPNARVAAEPTFVWGPGGGSELSGIARYEILVDAGGGYGVVARVAHVAGRREYQATRDPALRARPLPEGLTVRWYVRTVDAAGNASASDSRAFVIDSTAPRPPVIVEGPAGPTNAPAPRFAWRGDQAAFRWSVSVAGADRPLLAAGGRAAGVQLPRLPDGEYIFSVAQVSAFGAEGAEEIRSFLVDTAAPAAPLIIQRPGGPATAPAYWWRMEPDAQATWTVLDGAGHVVRSADTLLSGVTLPGLAPGGYTFRLQQTDAAGNRSPAASEPFTVASGATAGIAAPAAARLPAVNAARLRPRAGATLVGLTPALRWSGGPPGATVFNVQIYRIVRGASGANLRLRKVATLFPGGHAVVVPRGRLARNACYVWRVWPFVGRSPAPRALGVSHFCTAGRPVRHRRR